MVRSMPHHLQYGAASKVFLDQCRYEKTPEHEILLSIRALVPLLVFLFILLKSVLKEPFPVITMAAVIFDLHRQPVVASAGESSNGEERRQKKRHRRAFSSFKYHEAGNDGGTDVRQLEMGTEMEEYPDESDLEECPEPTARGEGESSVDLLNIQEALPESDEEGMVVEEKEIAEQTNGDGAQAVLHTENHDASNLIYLYLLLALLGLILFNIGLTNGISVPLSIFVFSEVLTCARPCRADAVG